MARLEIMPSMIKPGKPYYEVNFVYSKSHDHPTHVDSKRVKQYEIQILADMVVALRKIQDVPTLENVYEAYDNEMISEDEYVLLAQLIQYSKSNIAKTVRYFAKKDYIIRAVGVNYYNEWGHHHTVKVKED